MRLALLLHLYQPPIQTEENLRKIAHECYFPLIKFLKNNKNIKCTLNIPLSLLEQMDKYGYLLWIKDVKELIDSERVEITGSAAYHPLLTKFSDEIIEEQVILNEYAQGYYFGKNKGFEGEDAFVVKNLNGFFPPELAVSPRAADVLDRLGYEWFLCDETAVNKGYGVYEFEGVGGDKQSLRSGELKQSLRSGELKSRNILCVVRNRNLSNLISFKRNLDTKDLYDEMDRCRYCAVALDAEFFGHHFSDGFAVLDSVVEHVFNTGGEFTTISEYVHTMRDNHFKTSDIKESTWGSPYAENSFRIWDNKDNNIHTIQWDIVYELISDIRKELNIEEKYYDPLEYETLAVWLSSEMKKIEDVNIKVWFDLHKIIFSDWFWWASKETFPDGKIAYDPEFIKRGLAVMADVAGEYGSAVLKDSFEKKKELLLGKL